MRIDYSRAALWLVISSSASSSLSFVCHGLSSSSDASSAGLPGNGSRGRPTPRFSTITTAPENTERSRRRKRKVAGAPLVDSTLLRFISEQKRQQEEQLSSVNMEYNSMPSSSSSPSPNEKQLSESAAVDVNSVDYRNVDRIEKDLPSSGTESTSLRTDTWDSWLGQYNHNRVAQELIILGASEDAAVLAGEKVQSYVLTRTARRRIRIFLRERDSLWDTSTTDEVDDHDIEETKLSTDATEQLLLENDSSQSNKVNTPPNYGFNDVLEVLLDFGLTGKDICTILTHSPNLAMMMPRKSFMRSVEQSTEVVIENDSEIEKIEVSDSSNDTLEDTLTRAFVNLLQHDLKLRKYDARKILRTCPGLLSVRGSQAAAQNMIIMTKLGVSRNSIARDKTSLPMLLSRSPAAIFRLVSFLSSDNVRMHPKQIGPLLRRPVSRELLNCVAPVPKLEIPTSVDSVDSSLGPFEESTLNTRYQEERTQRINDLYRNMTNTAQLLRYQVGTQQLDKLISAYPSALMLSAEDQILPAAEFLVEELGIWEEGLAGVLQQYPKLLSLDVEDMRKVTTFLEYLGVKEEDLGSIFRSFPALLTLDIENDMSPVVEFLIEIGVSDVGAFVTSLPPVLGYNVEKELRPKWEYLSKVCLRPTFEINSFPAFFSYPLERVIRTRYEYLADKGIARQLVPVDAVVRFGDIDFATRIARDDDGGNGFRAFLDERKKSSGGKQKQKNAGRPKQANRPKTV